MLHRRTRLAAGKYLRPNRRQVRERDVLDDPDVWLPPHLRRLLERYRPLKYHPEPRFSETWAELLAETPEPWNPKARPKIKVKVRLKRKRKTKAQLRAYKRDWEQKKRNRLRKEGKLPKAHHRWKTRGVRRPGMVRNHLPSKS